MTTQSNQVNYEAIPFWDNSYKFNYKAFKEMTDRYLWESEVASTPNNVELSQEEYENLINFQRQLSDQEIEDENSEAFFSFFDLNLSQRKLCILSHREKKSRETNQEIKRIWVELENVENLTFITSHLLRVAEKKLKFEYHLPDKRPYRCKEELLLKYLECDLNLLRSRFVIEFIKYKQRVHDSKFLKKINKIICPKGTNKRSQKEQTPDFVQAWIYVQVIEAIRISEKENLKSICFNIANKFYNAIPIKIIGLNEKRPSDKYIERMYYLKKEDFSSIDDQSLISVIKASLKKT